MAAQGYFQRAPRQIDLGDGRFYCDNNIAAKHYADFAAGFNGESFTGRAYTERWHMHQYGARIRTEVDSGTKVVSQLPQMKGRVIDATAEAALSRH